MVQVIENKERVAQMIILPYLSVTFNEVDNLIFSCIPYLDLTGIVPAFKQGKVTLNEVAETLEKENRKPKGLTPHHAFKMIRLMKNTKRYGNTVLYNYINIVNDETQFTGNF